MKKKSVFGFPLTGGKPSKKVLRERIRHLEDWIEKGKYRGAMLLKAKRMVAAYRWQLAQFDARSSAAA